eukprot:UN10938
MFFLLFLLEIHLSSPQSKNLFQNNTCFPFFSFNNKMENLFSSLFFLTFFPPFSYQIRFILT